jgi:hypothetical protein
MQANRNAFESNVFIDRLGAIQEKNSKRIGSESRKDLNGAQYLFAKELPNK